MTDQSMALACGVGWLSALVVANWLGLISPPYLVKAVAGTMIAVGYFMFSVWGLLLAMSGAIYLAASMP